MLDNMREVVRPQPDLHRLLSDRGRGAANTGCNSSAEELTTVNLEHDTDSFRRC